MGPWLNGLQCHPVTVCGAGSNPVGPADIGIHDDNRIENLRIVCPNCNAGLDTFAGKCNKIVKKCECGSEINITSNKCNKCDKFSRRLVDRPDKEQLLKYINELGYCGTGRKYGVSDNSIRKWLK